TTSLSQYTHVYTSARTYQINVTVRDACNNVGYGYTSVNLGSTGGTGSTTSIPFVLVNPPKVSGYNVTLSGTIYATAQGASINWGSSTINWGDGTNTSATSYTHTYSRQGNYPILISVVDTNGNRNSASTSVSVPQGSSSGSGSITCSGSPTISLNQPSITGPLSIRVSGNVGASVTGGLISWGDGTKSALTHYTHTYPSAGNYQINVTVYDRCANAAYAQTAVSFSGSSSSSSSTNASRTSPPLVSINPPAISGLSVSLSGNASPTAPGAVIDWQNSVIKWGDGITTAAGMYTHTYSVGGNYTATLIVRDTYGNVNSASVTIHVNSVNCGQNGSVCI
ncbi:MAG: hypothetical protein KGH65_05870, partial [Candidatus Micrarchaeota archaeon]|nr:hypothetical protein [Candidatus Micrarchaeota archaeon]